MYKISSQFLYNGNKSWITLATHGKNWWDTRKELKTFNADKSLLDMNDVKSKLSYYNGMRGSSDNWDSLAKTLFGTDDSGKANETYFSSWLETAFNSNKDFTLNEYNESLKELVGNFTNSKQGCKALIKEFNSLGNGTGQLTNEQTTLMTAIRGTNFQLAEQMKGNPSLTWDDYNKSLIKTKASTIATTIATTALNAALSWGISTLASVAINALTEWADAQTLTKEEAEESLDELEQRFAEINNELKENQEMADETVDRYAELSKGVDSFGNNISLTNDEFSEYNDLSNKIADKFPTLITGYSDTGDAILTCKDKVDQLNESLKEANERLYDELVTNSFQLMEDYNVLYGNDATVNQRDKLGKLTSLDRDITKQDLTELNIDKKTFQGNA